jgi:YggT family protein
MSILADVISVYILVLWVRAILSWVLPPGSRGVLAEVNRWTMAVTEPLLAPIRRLLPMLRLGGVGIDLSVFVLMIILYIVRSAI